MPPGGGGEHGHGYGDPAESMPPGAGGGGERWYGEPAAAHGGERRDEEDPPRSSAPPLPLLPALAVVPIESEEKKKLKHDQLEVNFPEDVLIEILSRVPYRSLCRFKCVSKPWLALCSDRSIQKRSPQTLTGFFHCSGGFRFHNLSGKGPPMVDPDLPFLRGTYKFFRVLQCSTSLLLCKCWKSPHLMQGCWNSFQEGGTGQQLRLTDADQLDYVVCNPATQEWTSLPPIEWRNQADDHFSCFSQDDYILGFDPAVPSRFVVFVSQISHHSQFTAMIYSSDARGWTSVQGHWDDLKIYWLGHTKFTFLNGSMHFSNYASIVTVDVKGNAGREIKKPPDMADNYDHTSIGQSQGCLYAWCTVRNHYQNDCRFSVWFLENYDSGQWTLKCSVNCLELFGRDRCKEGESYRIFAIHPDCDLIFLTDGKEKTLSYDMTNQKVHVISASGDFLGGLPYTPCFAEWKSDGH